MGGELVEGSLGESLEPVGGVAEGLGEGDEVFPLGGVVLGAGVGGEPTGRAPSRLEREVWGVAEVAEDADDGSPASDGGGVHSGTGTVSRAALIAA